MAIPLKALRQATFVHIKLLLDATLYPQKLALTSPTGCGRSVCIVRSRTKTTEFVFSCFRCFNCFKAPRYRAPCWSTGHRPVGLTHHFWRACPSATHGTPPYRVFPPKENISYRLCIECQNLLIFVFWLTWADLTRPLATGCRRNVWEVQISIMALILATLFCTLRDGRSFDTLIMNHEMFLSSVMGMLFLMPLTSCFLSWLWTIHASVP
jgi:hypothetical protein